MFVYRSDYRKPADIFVKGFEALGDNDSLEDHVMGSSCRTGTSTTAFVATTSSETFAVNWGRDRAIIHSGASEFYVYKMRATENFYSAGASLREAYRKTGDSKYVALADHYEYQKEWLAVGGVPASQVEMADVYSTPDKSGNVVRIRSEVNPNYDRTIEGSGNPKPYIPKGQPSRRRFRLPNFVTACFTGNGGALSTLNTAKNQNAGAEMSIASLLHTWKNLLLHASRKTY
jgi:pertussis toxin subunit 1